MIEASAGRQVIKVPMTMANARGLLSAGRAVLQPGDVTFDLSAVTDADSSAVAVMLAWLRESGQTRSTVKFVGIPDGVRSLADLYGLTDHLPFS